MMKKFYGIIILILFVHISFAQKISPPQPISPANEMVNALPNAILDWTAITGVGEITYHIQLATDDAFNNLIVDLDNIDISAYYTDELLFGQQYFWRVKGQDENDITDWSESYSFTVFSMVELSKPKNGAENEDIRPNMEWKDKIDGTEITDGFSGFQIEFDTVDTFDSPQYRILVTDAIEFEKIIDYLLFDQVYFWRVRPYHSESTGEWSEVWSFNTIFGTELDKPNNNSTDEEFDLELSWEEVESNKGLIEYTIEVSKDENFTAPVTLITTETEIIPDFIKFDTKYWWRAKAGHVNDESDWTETRTFSTITGVELIAPEDGEVVQTIRPNLEWESIAGVDGYQIIIDESASYPDPTFYTTTGEDSDTYPLPALEKDVDYYWSVRAFRSSDTSAWAEQYHFNVPPNVGLENITILENINVFPNPATTYLNITFDVRQATELSWVVTDVLGQNVIDENLQVQTGLFSKDINVADLNKGIYFLEITQGERKKVMKFVIK